MGKSCDRTCTAFQWKVPFVFENSLNIILEAIVITTKKLNKDTQLNFMFNEKNGNIYPDDYLFRYLQNGCKYFKNLVQV